MAVGEEAHERKIDDLALAGERLGDFGAQPSEDLAKRLAASACLGDVVEPTAVEFAFIGGE